MKVSELEDWELDYWVAKLEAPLRNAEILALSGRVWLVWPNNPPVMQFGCENDDPSMDFNPSNDWETGGPIIERERIELRESRPDRCEKDVWIALAKDRRNMPLRLTVHAGYGPTPLIAAMRAYVASKFGGEVNDE